MKRWLLVLCSVASAQPTKVSVAPEVEAEVVSVPAGAFAMGHPRSDPRPSGTVWKANEGPRRTVRLGAFEIDRYEVTVEMWAEFLQKVAGATAHHRLQAIEHDGEGYRPAVDPRTPIAAVSWVEARAFCRWRGMELPTEAQWERAAHGPGDEDRTWPWGEDPADCRRANLHSGRSSCVDHPAPVGTYGALGESPEGVADLAGNVAEWVRDVEAPYDEAETDDPRGPAAGPYRVVRGGSYIEWSARGRITARLGARPEQRSVAVGFRCARTLR